MGEEDLVNTIILCKGQARIHTLPSLIFRNRNAVAVALSHCAGFDLLAIGGGDWLSGL